MPDAAPIVSVLLPIYNVELYVAEAIGSILRQTFTDFELLIVDDGSSDRSADIARAFEAKDSRVRVRSRPNAGLATTLNELIEWSRGLYLARMDADDISLPDRLAKQVDFLTAHPDVTVVGCANLTMDEAGRRIGVIRHPVDQMSIEDALLGGHTPISHPTVMMRATAVKRAGGYCTSYRAAEDYDLWLRLSECSQLANLPDTLLMYRIHANSISGSNAVRQNNEMRHALSSARRRRGIVGELPPMTSWRPDNDARSQHAYAIQTGWTAWSNGFRDTWRHYALRGVRASPFSLAAWRLLVFGLIRRPTTPSDRPS